MIAIPTVSSHPIKDHNLRLLIRSRKDCWKGQHFSQAHLHSEVSRETLCTRYKTMHTNGTMNKYVNKDGDEVGVSFLVSEAKVFM